MTTNVVLLGSTGSIGTQALEVIAANPGAFKVRALSAAGSRAELLATQAITTGAEVVAVADPRHLDDVAAHLDAAAARHQVTAPELTSGPNAVENVAGMLDDAGAVVVNGITGSVGLRPTLAALASGARLALANKESLIAGGALVAAATVRPGQIVPVDSEHSAMAQALASIRHEKGLTSPAQSGASDLRRLILTASGGPFRGKTRADLTGVTADQALAHPTWAMGPVVTINSSTLVNKGLELIEASLLFDVDPDDITVVVHPQSIVHSMIEVVDGSTIAQASPPDMRLPIALGLSWPQRLDAVQSPCDWTQASSWTFEPVDDVTFPALTQARAAARASATHPAVWNAANEQAVAAFLAGRLEYLAMSDILAAVLDAHEGSTPTTVDEVEHAERWARTMADALIAEQA